MSGRNSKEVAEDQRKPKKLGFNFKSKPSNKINLSKGNLEAFKAQQQKTKSVNPISIKLATSAKKEEPKVIKKAGKVAAAFNQDTDSEEEEMPAEAKMRMKNVGRDTPTSAGPNSYNKGKQGFADAQGLWNKQQEELARKLRQED